MKTYLAGMDFSGFSDKQLAELFRTTLQAGIHGISYSPYLDGQQPGVEISVEQIRQRMQIIQPYVEWVRTFSCIEGNQHSPVVAHSMGLKTMVGVGVGEERDKNETELENGIQLGRDGYADILAIGNEVLLRGDVEADVLLDYIQRAKQALPNVPIGYVDAYFQFENHPEIVELCDVLLINCYPFWEGCPAEYALLYMKEMYRRIERISQGKKVIISETGWPNIGEPYGGAVPSAVNAMKYFINTCQWAIQENIDIFYFSSFDESWKVGDEGDVGAYWGLWDKNGNLKYADLG